jgi:DNA-directed RNA polymerase subunit RPC12/RpoP
VSNLKSENGIRCPSCGGRDIRTSHSRTILDSILQMFQKTALRCRGCSRRFYKHIEEGDLIHRSDRTSAGEAAPEQPEDANAGQP